MFRYHTYIEYTWVSARICGLPNLGNGMFPKQIIFSAADITLVIEYHWYIWLSFNNHGYIIIYHIDTYIYTYIYIDICIYTPYIYIYHDNCLVVFSSFQSCFHRAPPQSTWMATCPRQRPQSWSHWASSDMFDTGWYRCIVVMLTNYIYIWLAFEIPGLKDYVKWAQLELRSWFYIFAMKRAPKEMTQFTSLAPWR